MLKSVSSFGYKPRVLDIDLNSTHATREWRQWSTIFTNYLDDYKDGIPNKQHALISSVSPTAFEFIESCKDIESALNRLD